MLFGSRNPREKMEQILSDPIPFNDMIFVAIPLVLWGIMALTTWLSFRLCRHEPPKLRFIIAIAFLQVLLGLLTMYVVERIKYQPFLIIGTGLGIMLLSDLLFIKTFLKNNWKQSLPVWAIASGLQLVFLPFCSAVMILSWFVFYFMNTPPQP
jgi:hypothetical protein